MRLLNRSNLETAKLCDADESRYALQHVLVTDKETVVSNGHYLVRVGLPDGKPENFPIVEGLSANGSNRNCLVPREMALDALKALPKKNTIPIINNAALSVTDGEGAKVTLAVTDLDTPKVLQTKEPTGSRFPAYEAILCKGEPEFEIVLSADYMERLCKLAKAYNGSGAARFSFYGKDKAMRISTKANYTGQSFEAILMPMREEAALRKGRE